MTALIAHDCSPHQVGIAPLPAHFTPAHRHYGAVLIEKKAGGPLFSGTLIATDELPCMQVLTTAGAPLFSGETVSLRGGNGYCLDVEGSAVQARWTEVAEWQAFRIELVPTTAPSTGSWPGAPPPTTAPRHKPPHLLRHGDIVSFRAHTGRLLRCPRRDGAAEKGAGLTELDASAWSIQDAQLFEIVIS
jgi:hypothetical protein